jgi:hypothetical protein
MNQEKQKADNIISNITEVGLEKDVIHNPYEERLPYESIRWVNGGWVVKMWKQIPSLPNVPPLPIDE